MEKLKAELELATPHTLEYNGVSERFNETIRKKTRAYNRMPHKSVDINISLCKIKPDLNLN